MWIAVFQELLMTPSGNLWLLTLARLVRARDLSRYDGEAWH